MNVHLIHENFRRFLLNENIDPNDVCMYHYNPGRTTQRIILYKPLDDSNIQSRLFLDTVIIGAVLLQNTQEAVRKPCIPDTFQVSTIFTHKDYEGQGFQKLLMDCAFYSLGQKDQGLTSDQFVGTKPRAAKAWDKIKASDNYSKRETDEGNIDFDYYDTTPDPDDDCRMSAAGPAVWSSYEMDDTSNIQPQYDKMKANHEQYLKKIDRNDRSAFKNMLVARAKEGFKVRYSGL
jgi:hypothetical protein